jgi:hypothetical protein
MNKMILSLLGLAALISLTMPQSMAAQRRKVVVVHPKRVVVRKPVTHTKLVVHKGHPIRRVVPAAVIVRTPRRVVAVGAPLVYLPALVWSPRIVSVPSRDRLVWQDSENITGDEGWVDTTFGVDESGNALFLDINGQAGLNFAEVTFANGNVQVVDFNEQTHGTGIYKLLEFSDRRHVKNVRMLAKSVLDEAKLSVYLSK